ncbi:hypothetical protein KSP40_PGU011771 [Platanthera guangdongensis]|uniref:JmjC domain-containing protein n=1 Tax=Platanthera guangdongensis TaxID=2320717 RepID=A0ABR2LYG4_9ASPA
MAGRGNRTGGLQKRTDTEARREVSEQGPRGAGNKINLCILAGVRREEEMVPNDQGRHVVHYYLDFGYRLAFLGCKCGGSEVAIGLFDPSFLLAVPGRSGEELEGFSFVKSRRRRRRQREAEEGFSSVNRFQRYGVVKIFHHSNSREYHDSSAGAVCTALARNSVWRPFSNNRGPPLPNRGAKHSLSFCIGPQNSKISTFIGCHLGGGTYLKMFMVELHDNFCWEIELLLTLSIDEANNKPRNNSIKACLLLHTAEPDAEGYQRSMVEKHDKVSENSRIDLDEFVGEEEYQSGSGTRMNFLEKKRSEPAPSMANLAKHYENAGTIWDIFRRQDVPKLNEFFRVHSDRFEYSGTFPVYEQVLYLNDEHKRKLKDEFNIEPWVIQQHVGEAVFIPSGCPFRVSNLQSSVQLAFDFLSPESLGESVRMAQGMRCLPSDHEAKLKMPEVEKMTLYAASSAIREVQKIALDPKYRQPSIEEYLSSAVKKDRAVITQPEAEPAVLDRRDELGFGIRAG